MILLPPDRPPEAVLDHILSARIPSDSSGTEGLAKAML